MATSKRPNKIFLILIFILVLVIFAVLGFLLAKWLKSKDSTSTKPTATISSTKSPAVVDKTYTNEVYGFSFSYPSTWEEKKTEAASNTTGDIIFKVEFTDPDQLKKVKIASCVLNEKNNWGDINYPQTTCQPLIQNLTQEEKDKIDILTFEKNVYVWVYKPKTKVTSLSDWLNKTYSTLEGQATGFEIGPGIEITGIKGYAANIACCADYNMGYVIQNGDYIYRLGTNYKDGDSNGKNTLLDEISKTFKLLP
ncbi:MAG: hypothetical protein M1429_01000 [Patescibacteria group bacterium]|nr:hypothetical protein [Patescibacteria group bacterium]